MKNEVKIKAELTAAKKAVIELIKKFVPAEVMLEDYEATYLVGTCLEIFDNATKSIVDQAKQIDEIEEITRKSYEIINNQSIQIEELKRELIKLQVKAQ